MYADITIKAVCENPEVVQSILLEANAVYQGSDVQTDTYYASEYGKLKHRQGNIENVLMHYKRVFSNGVKKTEVMLYLKNPGSAAIQAVCGDKQVIAEVKKIRKIFFIDNVRFHIDQVQALGSFLEIEAIDLDGSVGEEVLYQQCTYYKELLQINDEDIINESYTDLIHQL